MLHMRFVIEAVMMAVYGQLLVPGRHVEYIIPYSTLLELYEIRSSAELVVPDRDEDNYVKQVISRFIEHFEQPLNRKKIERGLNTSWGKGAPIVLNEHVTVTFVNATGQAQYGEMFDSIETELILTSLRENAPIVTDQVAFQETLIEAEVPTTVYDIEDYEFALENK